MKRWIRKWVWPASRGAALFQAILLTVLALGQGYNWHWLYTFLREEAAYAAQGAGRLWSAGLLTALAALAAAVFWMIWLRYDTYNHND